MKVCAFVLRLDGANRDELISAVAALKDDFEAACQKADVGNFSIWHMQQYLFGYGESHSEDMSCFDGVFAKLPAGVTVACKPASMRLAPAMASAAFQRCSCHNCGRRLSGRSMGPATSWGKKETKRA